MHLAHAFIKSLTYTSSVNEFSYSEMPVAFNNSVHNISLSSHSFFIFTSFTIAAYTLTAGTDASLFGNYRCFRDAVIPKQLEWADLPAGSRMCSTVASDPTVQKRGRPRQPAPAWTDWWVGGSEGRAGQRGKAWVGDGDLCRSDPRECSGRRGKL